MIGFVRRRHAGWMRLGDRMKLMSVCGTGTGTVCGSTARRLNRTDASSQCRLYVFMPWSRGEGGGGAWVFLYDTQSPCVHSAAADRVCPPVLLQCRQLFTVVIRLEPGPATSSSLWLCVKRARLSYIDLALDDRLSQTAIVRKTTRCKVKA